VELDLAGAELKAVLHFPGLRGLSGPHGHQLDPTGPWPRVYFRGLWGFLPEERGDLRRTAEPGRRGRLSASLARRC
jgi:hypothetical protein